MNNFFANIKYIFIIYIACATGCAHCVSDHTCLPNECYSGWMYNERNQACDRKTFFELYHVQPT